MWIDKATKYKAWRKKKDRRFRSLSLKGKAHYLRQNIPESEKWFQFLWKIKGIEDPNDKYNVAKTRYIPDLVNDRFMYIVEIDGKYHNTKSQKEYDLGRDRYFERKGYTVFRIPANDYDSFCILVDLVENHRSKVIKREIQELKSKEKQVRFILRKRPI